MTDKARSYIRTMWPVLLGHVAAWLVIKVEPLGISIDSPTAVTMLGVVLAGLVYIAGRELERVRSAGRVGDAARWAGRFLLSLGLSIPQPEYPPGWVTGQGPTIRR